jgi:hypothetical protein
MSRLSVEVILRKLLRALFHAPRPADLPRFTAIQEDGAEQQTLVMSYGGYQERVLLDDTERERLAYGDWHGWEEWIARIPAWHAFYDRREKRGL